MTPLRLSSSGSKRVLPEVRGSLARFNEKTVESTDPFIPVSPFLYGTEVIQYMAPHMRFASGPAVPEA